VAIRHQHNRHQIALDAYASHKYEAAFVALRKHIIDRHRQYSEHTIASLDNVGQVCEHFHTSLRELCQISGESRYDLTIYTFAIHEIISIGTVAFQERKTSVCAKEHPGEWSNSASLQPSAEQYDALHLQPLPQPQRTPDISYHLLLPQHRSWWGCGR
jgi:hypothetical protein